MSAPLLRQRVCVTLHHNPLPPVYLCNITRMYDALAHRAILTAVTRHGAAAGGMLLALMNLSRDNTVCNRSLMKWVKAEAVFTEMQALRAAAASLPPDAAAIPTMSLAEVQVLLSSCSTAPNPMCR